MALKPSCSGWSLAVAAPARVLILGGLATLRDGRDGLVTLSSDACSWLILGGLAALRDDRDGLVTSSLGACL